jgi:transcription antitermination factor NusG
MTGQKFDGWCILRTKARDTARLAASLAADGVETWTPMETRSVRVPRSNINRRVRRPIMPSYVFARADHLVDLLRLSHAEVKPRRGAGLRLPAHADFRVMRSPGGIPAVTDASLAELRKLEVQRTPQEPKVKRKRPRANKPIDEGATVRVEGAGSLDGLEGQVERSSCSETTFVVGGRRITLPTCILADISLDG